MGLLYAANKFAPKLGNRFATYARYWVRALFLALALSTTAAGQPTREPNTATIDLRIGLARSVAQPGYLARGVGQGGFVELEKGGVVGALLPFSSARDVNSEYLELRQALEFTERFAIADCRPRSSKISVWFELEAADELAREPSSIGLWVTRGVRVFGVAGIQDNALVLRAGLSEHDLQLVMYRNAQRLLCPSNP